MLVGKRYSFAAHLAAFALLVVFPVVLLAGMLLLQSAISTRSRAEARLVQLAMAASASVDREMERHLLVLSTLSTMPSFGTDWRVFHASAQRALQGDGYIIVVDRDLAQLANTYVAYGEQPARTGDPETVLHVIASARPQASNVFTSLVTGGEVINFDLPILRNGQVRYVLCYGRPVGHLTRLLEGQALEAGWSNALFDGRGALIAATGELEERTHNAEASGGLARWRDSSGNVILRATHVSSSTGWITAIDVPLRVIDREINSALAWWIGFALATLLLALVVGVGFGRYLSLQLRRLAAQAAAVGQEHGALTPFPSTLREVALIEDSLQRADAELARRSERQRLLSSELNHRVKNILSVVQAMVALTVAKEAPRAGETILQRLQALGRSQDLLVRSDWRAIPLRDLVEAETGSFAERINVEGPAVILSRQSVQSFGLVLHELVTNAAKYGALRDNGGRIELRWIVEGEGDAARFKLTWKEHCTGPVKAGETQGFGTELIKRAFESEGAEPRLALEPDGLIFELDAPLRAIAEAPSV